MGRFRIMPVDASHGEFTVWRFAADDERSNGAGRWQVECQECWEKVLYHPYVTTLDGVSRFLSNHRCKALAS